VLWLLRSLCPLSFQQLLGVLASEISLALCFQQLFGVLASEISLVPYFSAAVRLFGCILDLCEVFALDRFGSGQALFPECLCFALRCPRRPLSG